tara:strand:- start:735 stop:1004 length:270 start_codon:yes stop_codon:yes gene_type:complete
MKKTTTFILATLIAAFILSVAPSISAHDEHKHEKTYKPGTCVVSGDDLEEMGKPFVFNHEGKEIKLCCKSCRKDFDKDPGKYLRKLEGK